jgi:hypothetical protein
MFWTNVERTLPKEGRLEVLVSNGYSVAPAWWVDGAFEAFCQQGHKLRWVTHWQRFPSPPNATGEGSGVNDNV